MAKICIVKGSHLTDDATNILNECVQSLKSLGIETAISLDHSLATDGESKRIHDIREAKMTLSHALADIKAGYHFDDEFAAMKTDAITKAVSTLSEEATKLVSILRPDIN